MRDRSLKRIRIIGVGACLPRRVVSNDEIAKHLVTTHQWIVERTGIMQRAVADRDETAITLASAACLEAINHAGIAHSDIGALIVATSTPDRIFPSTAAGIQRALGLESVIPFDIQAACAGFLYSLSVAKAMLETGQAQTALVVGVDLMTRLLNFRDRATAILFGDGAGAVVLTTRPAHHPWSQDGGIIGCHVASHVEGWDDLKVDGGGGTPGRSVGKVTMNGNEVFRMAVGLMGKTVTTVLKDNNVSIDDVAWMVPHQANARIIHALGRQMKIPQDRIYQTVHLHANTSAASLPLALHHGIRAQKIVPGQNIMLVAMGAGYVYGSALIRL